MNYEVGNNKDMQEHNKKNLILFALLAIVGLTAFSTVVMLCGGGFWSCILPVMAIGYAIYCVIKKYLPLTK